MAETLAVDLSQPRIGRPEKYPWDVWFDGRTWRLTQGADFGCTVKAMCSSAYRAAQRRGVAVVVRADWPNRVLIQAPGREPLSLLPESVIT